MSDMEDRKWTGTTDGNSTMHRWLIGLLRHTDVRVVYLFAYVFVVPVYLFLPGFRPIYHYFRRQWHYGPLRAFMKAYRNHCMFAQVVIDRFAIYAGQHFHIDIEGHEHYERLSSQKAAFVQLSSHIGNYELAGYSLTSANKTIHALVFSGEKASVMENRRKMFASKNIDMIAVREDMSHLFLIDQALRQGGIVSMPADRIFGSPKAVKVRLLDGDAALPQGPFSVASMRGLDVVAVNVMKSSTKGYTIHVTPLPYDKQTPRRQQIEQLAQGYASELERMLRLYPTQWYNFFEFWT